MRHRCRGQQSEEHPEPERQRSEAAEADHGRWEHGRRGGVVAAAERGETMPGRLRTNAGRPLHEHVVLEVVRALSARGTEGGLDSGRRHPRALVVVSVRARRQERGSHDRRGATPLLADGNVIADMQLQLAQRAGPEGDLVRRTRCTTVEHDRRHATLQRCHREGRRGDPVDAKRAIPHRVEHARDIAIGGNRRKILRRDESLARGHDEIPDDAGALRAGGGVGEPGAEGEASDDAQHADDCTDQRRADGDCAPTAAGLDREPRTDRERRRESGAGRPPARGRRRRLGRVSPGCRPDGGDQRRRKDGGDDGRGGEAEHEPVGVDPDVEVVTASLTDRKPR